MKRGWFTISKRYEGGFWSGGNVQSFDLERHRYALNDNSLSCTLGFYDCILLCLHPCPTAPIHPHSAHTDSCSWLLPGLEFKSESPRFFHHAISQPWAWDPLSSLLGLNFLGPSLRVLNPEPMIHFRCLQLP